MEIVAQDIANILDNAKIGKVSAEDWGELLSEVNKHRKPMAKIASEDGITRTYTIGSQSLALAIRVLIEQGVKFTFEPVEH